MPGMSPTPPGQPYPLNLRLFTLVSWLLGWMLTLDGLHQRLWNAFWQPAGWMPWVEAARSLGAQPLMLGWPFVVSGLSLVGASFGLYLRRGWGLFAGVAVCVLALGYFALGTPLALTGLVLLGLPPTRAYLRADPAP